METRKIGIELPKETIQSLLSGSKKFIIPINFKELSTKNTFVFWRDIYDAKVWAKKEEFINKYSPLQINDDFFVQEDFSRGIPFWNIVYDRYGNYTKASDMSYNQSRIKGKVIDIDIKQIKDLSYYEIKDIGTKPIIDYKDRCPETGMPCSDYYSVLRKQYNNYDENPYVFIITIGD